LIGIVKIVVILVVTATYRSKAKTCSLCEYSRYFRARLTISTETQRSTRGPVAGHATSDPPDYLRPTAHGRVGVSIVTSGCARIVPKYLDNFSALAVVLVVRIISIGDVDSDTVTRFNALH